MGFITDEMLFYGGIAVAGGALLLLLIYGCVSQMKKIQLNARLDAEYGEQPKR